MLPFYFNSLLSSFHRHAKVPWVTFKGSKVSCIRWGDCLCVSGWCYTMLTYCVAGDIAAEWHEEKISKCGVTQFTVGDAEVWRWRSSVKCFVSFKKLIVKLWFASHTCWRLSEVCVSLQKMLFIQEKQSFFLLFLYIFLLLQDWTRYMTQQEIFTDIFRKKKEKKERKYKSIFTFNQYTVDS